VAMRLLLLTIFSAVTAISIYMVAMRLLLLTIFSAVTAISIWLQCGSCFLLYSRRWQRYQHGCNAALASYYILGGDSDINMVAMRLLLLTIFSAVTAISTWLQRGSCFLLYSRR